MRKNLEQLKTLFANDEELLRLLHYTSETADNDPLSPDKPNILEMPIKDRALLINNLIKPSPSVYGLDDSTRMCRLLFYPKSRRSSRSYLTSDQEVNIDVFVHHNFNNTDYRLSWICDRVNDLLFDKPVVGFGRVNFVNGNDLPAPQNYVGYQLRYSFGSVN